MSLFKHLSIYITTVIIIMYTQISDSSPEGITLNVQITWSVDPSDLAT